jgi:predicted phage terminase large subunit-like protein
MQYQSIRQQRQKHPRVVRQYIEDKASGIGILQQGQIDGEPFGSLNPGNADKVRRATAVSIQYQSGLVYHLAGASFLDNLEKEMCIFPAGEHDDQVDGVSYAGIIFQAQIIKGRQARGSLVLSSAPSTPSESTQDDSKQNGNGNGDKPRQSVLERILGYQPQSGNSSRFGRFEDD